jgi:hypothetical protein
MSFSLIHLLCHSAAVYELAASLVEVASFTESIRLAHLDGTASVLCDIYQAIGISAFGISDQQPL